MKHLEDILNIIREKNLWRKTVAYQQIDGNYVMLNEKKCLMLASNNYLGLTHNDKIQQASIAAIVNMVPAPAELGLLREIIRYMMNWN